MTTEDNLKAAFAGESQANRRYLAFARKAEVEGLKNIARLFRAAAEAETVHALNHLRVLAEVKSTKDNLKAAIDGERYENTKMYPDFIEEARRENRSEAGMSFEQANQVEKIHQGLYEKALGALESGSDLEEGEYWVCQTCGNTVEGGAPEVCPICGKPKSQFRKVE